MHAVGQHFNLRPNFELENVVIIHNSIRHEVQYKRMVATWPQKGVVSLVYRLHCVYTQYLLYLVCVYIFSR